MNESLLSGLRIVEVSAGFAASIAGVLFADYGAEVIKLEPPGGEPARATPGFIMWNRGKKSVACDFSSEAGRTLARSLALTADVVISNLAEERLRAIGLDHAALRQTRPDLICCTISGFGLAHRHESLGSDDPIVMAKSGRLMGNDALSGAHGATDRPVFLTAQFGSYGAGMLAFQGILAALLRRARTGHGDHVQTSVLDGTSAATMRLAFERRGDEVVPVAARNEASRLVLRGIHLCFLTVKTKDDRYIQMCCRAPHLYHTWMKAIGLYEEFQLERWKGLPLGVKSYEDGDLWEEKVRQRMSEKTQEEWMTLFRTIDVGADPFLTFEEFLQHPQMVQNGRITEVTDAEHGRTRMVGPLVLFSDTPAHITHGAPRIGQHQGELEAMLARRPTATGILKTPAMSPTDPPLKGYTILELASFLAAPLGPTLLAELGARVIKVEPLEGDPFRSSGLEFVHIGNGKESIALDLKHPRSRDILKRLIEKSDALIHNFRPGVPERLGFGYEEAHKINPRLVYLYGASYGSKGPESHRAAFHSTPNALTGGGILQAGAGNRPVNDSYADPCSGLGTGSALALGLLARELTGKGQYLETTMLTSTGWVHSERLVQYAGQAKLPLLDAQQLGYGALRHLYATADGWIMLAIADARGLPALSGMLARALGPGHRSLADAARPDAGDEARMAALSEAFRQKNSAEWEKAAAEFGVPLASAYGYTFEQFLVQEGMVKQGEHPAFGSYWRLPPRVRFDEARNLEGEPCALGEHSRALLAEIGCSEQEVAALISDGVVGALAA